MERPKTVGHLRASPYRSRTRWPCTLPARPTCSPICSGDQRRQRDSPGASANLEPKATLRAIIAEGRWEAFRADYLHRSRTLFEQLLTRRLEQAVGERRLGSADEEPVEVAAAA